MDLGLKSHMKGLMIRERTGGGVGGAGAGGGGRGAGRNLRVILVWVCEPCSISKPTPFIYLAFEKNGPIHILDHPKC